MDPKLLTSQLDVLTEAQVISTPERNLRSKIDSLLRSIENLESKRARIDYELKKQKRSLARKRMELKKDSKHLKAKTESALKAGVLIEQADPRFPWNSIDDYLLQESARKLDD